MNPRMASIYSIRCCGIATAKLQKKAEILGLLARKYYFCIVKERIVWADWAKALAAIGIVFIHLPQSQEWFYYRYLQATVVVIFFFMSGYLKKDRGTNRANWHKYWHSLLLPYFIYNALLYPYWWIKFYLQHGAAPDIAHALRPVIGTLLLQHENAFCEPLDGPLWYLPAILILHLTVDLCRKSRHEHLILTALCLASVILYAANKYYYFAPNLTPMGLMRNLPYYYMGYLFRRYNLFGTISAQCCLAISLACLAGSLLLFRWHLICFFAGYHLWHIFLFYPVCLAFLFGVIYACRALNGFNTRLISHLSIGTLVIVGLHIVLITALNFVIERTLGLTSTYCYQWHEALLAAIFITALLYPVILLAKKRIPLLLGR